MRKTCLLSQGFTILEVLVVLVILGLIMGIGSARFRDFQKRQSVVAAKRQIMGDLRAAQSDVSSGRKPSDCTGTLQGFTFEVTAVSAPAEYEVGANCTTATGSQFYLVKSAALPDGISLSLPSVNPIIFRPLSLGTNLAANSTVSINVTGSGLTEVITVTAAGGVR